MRKHRYVWVVAAALCGPALIAQPAAAAPRSVTRVALLSSSQWGPDGSGFEHAVGEVEDEGTTDVDLVQVNLNFYDKSNQLVGTDSTFATVDTLAPGERSPFDDTFSPPAGYTHFSVSSIAPSVAPAAPNHYFTTSVGKVFVDAQKDTHYVGTVRNDNTTSSSFVKVVFTFYSSAHTAVAQDVALVNTDSDSDLAPWQTGPFDEVLGTGVAAFPRVASYVELAQSGSPPSPPAASGGYWLAASDGQVFAAGPAPRLGGTSVLTSNPVVGIASTPDRKGYWLVTAGGTVYPFGDAHLHGDLPAIGVHISDIVAITPTGDGAGYWMIGRDGGEFAFGDARYHGSLPGVGVHVGNIVGMVATATGGGYWVVGSDGGVFAFGNARYKGSLPSIGVHVDDVRAMIASPTRGGYILVGDDGGTFVFGSGVHYYGSLPGKGVHVTDIVGLALTPAGLGYWLAGADGHVYGFGDGAAYPRPSGVTTNLPIVAIAGA